jgi:hypothetical protein
MAGHRLGNEGTLQFITDFTAQASQESSKTVTFPARTGVGGDNFGNAFCGGLNKN